MDLAANVVKEVMMSRVGAVALPWALSSSFSVFHYLHRAWRLITEETKFSHQLFGTAANTGFNYCFGDNAILQRGAQWILVITKIDECAEGYFALARSYEKLEAAISNEFPTPSKIEWIKDSTDSYGFSLLRYELQRDWEKTTDYVSRVTIRAFKLLKKFFILSMLMIDAAEACEWNGARRREAVGELTAKLLDYLSTHPEELVKRLNENRNTIQQILDVCEINASADDLVDNILQEVAVAGDIFHSFDHNLEDTFVRALKDIIFGGAATLGLHNALPSWLVPDPSFEEAPLRAEKKYGRYVPKEWITRRYQKLQMPDTVSSLQENENGEEGSLGVLLTLKMQSLLQRIFS